VYWGESQVKKESMERAVRICQEKKLTVYEENGALLVDLTKFKMDKSIITKGGEFNLIRAGDIPLLIPQTAHQST
jgi:arginyl-tRNA synthetase